GGCKCALNCLEHTIDIRQHLVIPETNHSITLCFENLRSLRVRGSLFHMLLTIDLDHQLGTMTREINDVATDAHLAPEVGVRDREAMTQMPPKLLLSLGRRLAHGARKDFVRRDERAIASRPDARVFIRFGIADRHCLSARPPPLTPPHKGEGNWPC